MFSSRLLMLLRSRGGAQTYTDKVNGTSPLAHWVLNETAGAVFADQINSPAQDGSITGVSLNNSTGPDGEPVGLWDGANDYGDIYSVTLDGAFNGAEGTAICWAKVSAGGVWTDGAARGVLSLREDANNHVAIQKTAVNNTLTFIYKAGGVTKNVTKAAVSSTGWVCYGITWSAGADELRAYFNGVQEGAAVNGLGVYAGGVGDAARTAVGALRTTPANVWDGWCAHAAVWTSALTPAQMLDIATV